MIIWRLVRACSLRLHCAEDQKGNVVEEKAASIVLRDAYPAERRSLEELQWRASLVHPAYRDALLENRSIVHLPAEHLSDGGGIVAEIDGKVVGFAIMLPVVGGESELDGLFVEPEMAGHGVGRALVEEARRRAGVQVPYCLRSSPRWKRRGSITAAVLSCLARRKPCSARHWSWNCACMADGTSRWRWIVHRSSRHWLLR